MRGIARFGVVSFMVVALLATGAAQATAQADVCVSVRGDTKVSTETRSDCRSAPTSLTIGITNTAGPMGYLKLDDVRGESRNISVEDGLLSIALDPD
jgi:hypothetical protein